MRPRTLIVVALLASWLIGVSTSRATTNILYTASTGLQPTYPQWFGVASGGLPTGAVIGNSYFDVSSTATNSLQYGYQLVSPPLTLDVVAGYELSFRLRIASESHSTTNRGGFSIIAIGSDPTKSLELSFWTDHVWTYNYNATEGFTHGLDLTLDTTAVHDYALQVQNQNFTLFVDNAPLLSGPMQNYTGTGLPFPDPYDTPNELVFGDDTTSASSEVDLYNLIFTNDVIPEPSTIVLVGLGLLGALRLRKRTP